MAGAKEDINGVEGTLFKDTDPPVYLLPDGRFAMKYGGVWKIRNSVKPLLKLLGRFQTAVKLMKPPRIYGESSYNYPNVAVIDVVSWERGMIGRKDGKREKDRYGEWYEYDAKLLAELEANRAALELLSRQHAKAMRVELKKRHRLMKRCKQVTEGNFRNLIAGIDSVRPRAKVKRGETA